MIHVFHSAMSGAPTLNGTAGSLIAVLDACLVNGWSSQTPDSIVIAAGIGTVTRAAGHPFEIDAVAEIAGATIAGGGTINGKQKVLSTTSSTWTFDATGIANQTAGGTITTKVAPLGMSKQYSGTNLAAYKITDVLGTGCLLRVDDTVGRTARVVGYQTMSDVNTGVGPFPNATQLSGGAWWAKSQVADASSRPWTIVGDSRGFFFSCLWNTAYTTYGTASFGDFKSLKSADSYACTLAAQSSDLTSSQPGIQSTSEFSYVTGATQSMQWLARGVSGLGGSVPIVRTALTTCSNSDGQFSGGGNLGAYPNPADNGMYVTPFSIGEFSPTRVYRGSHPGAWFCPQTVTGVFGHRDKVTGVTGLTGRKLMSILGGSGVLFLDITGPWDR